MFRMVVAVTGLSLALVACNQDPGTPEVTKTEAPETHAAALPEETTAGVASGDVLFEASGTGLSFTATNFVTVEPVDGAVVLTRTEETSDGYQSGGKTAGGFLTLDYPMTADIAEKGLRIELSVSSESSFSVAYSTASKGNSGWRTFEASPEVSTVSFNYSIAAGEDPNADFLGIMPADGSSVVVHSVKISVR